MGVRAPDVPAAGLDGEAVTSLGASSANDTTAAASFHADQKAVGTLAAYD
jgi:hypothetical protein